MGRFERDEDEFMRQVIVHSAEDGGFWAECPSLPGCVSQGDTPEDAIEAIKEAIALYIASLEARGLPLPDESVGRIMVVDV
jgi:predicted RNase H-like HicB family nuclease